MKGDGSLASLLLGIGALSKYMAFLSTASAGVLHWSPSWHIYLCCTFCESSTQMVGSSTILHLWLAFVKIYRTRPTMKCKLVVRHVNMSLSDGDEDRRCRLALNVQSSSVRRPS